MEQRMANNESKGDSLQQFLSHVKFRCIGPVRGGRVVAVAGDPTDPATFYFGAVAGGVWKTTDAGTTWLNISDGYFKTSSVGDIAVAPSDPNVIYAGMGESTIRTDVSHGDGVYKSNDGGKSWVHCGLADTRHIGKLRVHPKNPDIVYVAALGHAFGANQERGVFRSNDGGKTWQQVLFKSDKAGAVDLTFDPRNPDILYASIWQVYRNFWELNSGGPDSGLWKSMDGGDTWSEITGNQGLPKGIWGKVGLSASPVQAGRLWALVEVKEGKGMYRSDDWGATWQMVSDNPDLTHRPFYYMHVHADSQDADTVYVSNLNFLKSTDGGKTWLTIPTPHGDNHALWIDPNNNRRMIQGNDGGANVSFNAGESFSTIYNQLTAQIYHMTVDNEFPYRVYGTQQDNSSIRLASDTISGAITWSDSMITGTGESGYIAVHPNDSNIVYVGAVGSSPGGMGALQRCDMRSEQIQLVNVWPEDYNGRGVGELKYRFPWTFPILFSPHDPNLLYTCGNVAFRSNNGGQSWEPFSPDLTRADMSKLGPSGGPITFDTSGAEHYASIYTFRESPQEKGVFWAGSDDGLVHISHDNGQSWHNITPPDLPEWSFIRTLEPSSHDKATCYLAATRYKLDDTTPYLYKTADYGKTWTKISDGIPAHDFTRVIRSDPNRHGLLYCGTETGLYLSLDDGGRWLRWESNLPVTPVYDLLVKGNDLVIGTHGRSFWILDDLTRLYQWAEQQTGQTPFLFAPGKTYRILPDLTSDWLPSEGKIYGLGLGAAATLIAKKDENGQVERVFLDAGEGATRGVVVTYFLPQTLEASAGVLLAFLDEKGALLRTFAAKPADYEKWDEKKKSLEPGPWLPLKAGFNRLVWNLRLPGAVKVAGNKTAGEAFEGPFVLPGVYQVRLTVGEQALTEKFEVVNDPRAKVSLRDLQEQQRLHLRILGKISEAHTAVNQLRVLREQVEGWQKRAATHEAVSNAAAELLKKLAEIEDKLILPGDQKNTYGLGQHARLNAALASVIPIVASADARPTKQAGELAAEYSVKIDSEVKQLAAVVKQDVAAFNKLVQQAKIPAVAA
jgi:photosystem II stability/assembly factor-like uncharacterized protein